MRGKAPTRLPHVHSMLWSMSQYWHALQTLQVQEWHNSHTSVVRHSTSLVSLLLEIGRECSRCLNILLSPLKTTTTLQGGPSSTSNQRPLWFSTWWPFTGAKEQLLQQLLARVLQASLFELQSTPRPRFPRSNVRIQPQRFLLHHDTSGHRATNKGRLLELALPRHARSIVLCASGMRGGSRVHVTGYGRLPYLDRLKGSLGLHMEL